MGKKKSFMRPKNYHKNDTITITKEQLNILIENSIRKKLDEIKEQATDDGINRASMLMFALPAKVLMEHFWQNNYRKQLPEFMDRLIEEYSKWQDGEVDILKVRDDLWEFAGVRIEVDDEEDQ